MTESMIVEAVRAAQSGAAVDATAAGAAGAPASVADPVAVERFQAAMGAGGSSSVARVDPIPFASEASAAWRSAQVNNQGLLHRIRALTELGRMHGPAAGELVELQYEVMNLSLIHI